MQTSNKNNVWWWYIFSSERLRKFTGAYIHQAASPSYNHQSNGQAETFKKFLKHMMKKCFDLYLVVLQIQSTLTGSWLLSPAAFLFNRPIRGLRPKPSRSPTLFDHGVDHYTILLERQWNAENDKDTHKSSLFLSGKLNVVVQCEDGGLWTYRTVFGHSPKVHSKRSHKITVMKIGYMITRKQPYVKNTPIWAEVSCMMNSRRIHHG